MTLSLSCVDEVALEQQALLDAMPLAVVLIDLKSGIVRHVNPLAKKLGFERLFPDPNRKADAVRGQVVWLGSEGKPLGSARKPWQQLVNPEAGRSTVCLNQAGRPRYFAAVGSYLPATSGSDGAALVTFEELPLTTGTQGHHSSQPVRALSTEGGQRNASVQPTGTLSGARILVVEDDDDSRELIELLLTTEGATVRSFPNAEQALAGLSFFRPDVVVSDIGMPERDGFWLLRELRRRSAALPVIALTAFTSPEDVRQALAAGFNAHLGKPVAPEKLVQVLARAGRELPSPSNPL